jgi:uncharacterized membrane protein HdeD (DUF308 family)
MNFASRPRCQETAAEVAPTSLRPEQIKMSPAKTIIGVLAILWIVASIVGLFTHPIPTGALATSWWMGKVTAVCVGVIVAIICFKPRRKSDAKP